MTFLPYLMFAQYDITMFQFLNMNEILILYFYKLCFYLTEIFQLSYP